MAISEIPPVRPDEESGVIEAPVLVLQLRDDLARSRLREAFWISIVAHLVLLILIGTSPRWMPMPRPVRVKTAEELIRERELTYLAQPHDTQRVDKPPDTNRISDKNRIATKRPTIDRKTLDELRDSARPGPPQPSGPPVPAQQPGQMAQAPPQPPRPQPQQSQPQTQARLEAPPSPTNPFAAAMRPGQAIDQAARAAASSRTARMGYGGSSGDYGLGTRSPGKVNSNLDILSDTMGVDFGPYLERVLHDVRINWYNLIPEVARAPLMKRGKVEIVFYIMKDGSVQGMQLAGASGDVSLDRAAWGGITASNPFPPLPGEFRGPFLALRFRFYYNPAKGELE